MAAFSSSSKHNPFLIDSSLFPNTISTINKNMLPLLEEPNINAYFSQFHQQETLDNLDQSTKILAPYCNFNDNSIDHSSVPSVTRKNSMDSSSIVTHVKYDENEQGMTQKVKNPNEKKRKCKEGSFASCAQSKDKREVRGKKEKKMKDGEEENNTSKEEKKARQEPPTGYIHVRARRGQATDSHSLAERVRRERISERMRLLQALVPGCDKVTGKALMLDEIINYVQSLQNQVEFLSMKLASVNPMFYDFGMDLESFMVRPDENLSNLPSPLPSMHEYNNLSHLENSANSILFQHAQIPNALPQENRQVLWEMDEQRQRIINQCTGFSNNLFSLH